MLQEEILTQAFTEWAIVVLVLARHATFPQQVLHCHLTASSIQYPFRGVSLFEGFVFRIQRIFNYQIKFQKLKH